MSVAPVVEFAPQRHLKVSGARPALGFARCEDPGCVVLADGTCSSCGRLACPSCGCSGTNLSTFELSHLALTGELSCHCGHSFAHVG